MGCLRTVLVGLFLAVPAVGHADPPAAGLAAPTVAVPSGRLYFADTAALTLRGQLSMSWRIFEVQTRYAIRDYIEVAASALATPGNHGGAGIYAQAKFALVQTEEFAIAGLVGGGVSPRWSQLSFGMGGVVASACVDGAPCGVLLNATAHTVATTDGIGPLAVGGGFAVGGEWRLVVEYQSLSRMPVGWAEHLPYSGGYVGGRYRGRRMQFDFGLGRFERDNLGDPLELPLFAISGTL